MANPVELIQAGSPPVKTGHLGVADILPPSVATNDRAQNSSPQRPKHAAKAWSPSDYDIILSVQYYESVTSSHILSGERRLLLALLEDALRCYVRAKSWHSAAERAEFRDVCEWFGEGGEPHVFSFESVCANLDIDPQYLRGRLDSLHRTDFPRKQFHTNRRRSECSIWSQE